MLSRGIDRSDAGICGGSAGTGTGGSRPPAPSRRLQQAAVACALVLLAFAVFAPVRNYPYIDLDDTGYVTENDFVKRGFTREGAALAFTTFHAGNWHPVAWLSHMADVELFGLDAGRHHLVNLGFHGMTAIVLFLSFLRMTGALWRSALVAALFAVHPLHVESVAWISERKDLLCGLFFALSLWTYSGYARHGGWQRYSLTVLFFALALLSKPMAVTLPFVLLLLDLWPLGRLRIGGCGESRGAVPLSRLLLEKTPLFALSLGSCIVTYLAQREGGAVTEWESLPVSVRLGNALASYGWYALKTVWPSRLAVYYPHPGPLLPVWRMVVGLAVVLGASWLALRRKIRRPYLATGWFWYVGTLVPVIGIVQVGRQGMADRYAYLPIVGLFVMAVWGAAEFQERMRFPRQVPAVIALAILGLFFWVSRVQVGYWRSSEALLQRTVEVTPSELRGVRHFAPVYNSLGRVLANGGRHQEAISWYFLALRNSPDFVLAHNNMGASLGTLGRYEEAALHFREALRLDPGDYMAHHNLGAVLGLMGRRDEAVFHLREALRIRPGNRATLRELDFVLGWGNR